MPMRARAGQISFGGIPPAHGRGWSQKELREINRIRAACGSQFHIELAFGESDEGDPWCIVCEREGERVLLHIARIDCSYVIARPGRSRLQRTASITAASDLALRWLDRELREHFRPGHAA
jgi:hypothetical protein